MVSFSVIIPSFGGRSSGLLRRTLGSLAAATIPAGLMEVIVVENGPRGDAVIVCADFPLQLPMFFMYSPVASLSGARNTGAQRATGEVLIFFDDDIRLSRETLAAYSSAFDQYGTGYFFGGPTDIDYESPPDSDLLPFLPFSARGFQLSEQSLGLMDRAHRFLGANHAVPKHAFLDTMGNDSLAAVGHNAGGVGEETRLQDRLLAMGIDAIYVPDAMIWHYVPSASCNLAWLKTRYFRYGYTDAVLEAQRGPISRGIYGVPLWAIRERVEHALHRLRMALTRAPLERRIEAALRGKRLAGRIAGFMLARHSRPHRTV